MFASFFVPHAQFKKITADSEKKCAHELLAKSSFDSTLLTKLVSTSLLWVSGNLCLQRMLRKKAREHFPLGRKMQLYGNQPLAH